MDYFAILCENVTECKEWRKYILYIHIVRQAQSS